MQEDTKPREQTSRDDSESFETQQPLPRLCSVLSRPDLERIVAQNCQTTRSDALIPASQLLAPDCRDGERSELGTREHPLRSINNLSETAWNIRRSTAALDRSRHKWKEHSQQSRRSNGCAKCQKLCRRGCWPGRNGQRSLPSPPGRR